jgi:LmbE family N-acetylglucosaminyl deacetylase
MAPSRSSSDRRLVLSPHFDDAVFSAWDVLSSPAEVLIVTVFAGIPATGFVTALDRNRGGTESATIVHQRRADDCAALAMAGRQVIHLDLLDADYRAFQLPDLRTAIERAPGRFVPLVASDHRIAVAPDEVAHHLAGILLEDDLIYAPAGIGGHPDHRDLARLGLDLAQRGWTVTLYGDIPYLMREGLPGFLSGHANPRGDALVEAALNGLAPAATMERRIVTLSPPELERKLRALRRYETEFELVNADFGGVLDDRAQMQYEVYWRLLGHDLAPTDNQRPAHADCH